MNDIIIIEFGAVPWPRLPPYSSVIRTHPGISAHVSHVRVHRAAPTQTGIHQESSVRFTAGGCDMDPVGVRAPREEGECSHFLTHSDWGRGVVL